MNIEHWNQTLARLPDPLLLKRTHEHVGLERHQTAWLVAHLAEVERRDLALQAGHASLFKYARQELRLSDQMAYERVSAARLALQRPEVILKLAEGELTLASATELWRAIQEAQRALKAPAQRTHARNESLNLAPELPIENHPPAQKLQAPPKPIAPQEVHTLVEQVSGKTRRESEALLQAWKQERAGIQPPARSKQELQLQLTQEQLIVFDRLRDLLSHKLGSRSAEDAFAWLLQQGLEKLDPVRIEKRVQAKREKKASASHGATPDRAVTAPAPTPEPTEQQPQAQAAHCPPPNPAPIPAATERRVWIRDQGQCQYPDPRSGRICGSTAYLDVDHVIPKEDGGTNAEANLRLCCASHNRRRRKWEHARGSAAPARVSRLA